MNEKDRNYDDIINLPHHVSKRYPHMSIEARAAQFAPYAALTGHGDAVKETARLTNKRIDLDDDFKILIDEKIQEIKEKIQSKPEIIVIYFVPDLKKEGGEYVTVQGKVKKIDGYNQLIVLENNKEIQIQEILDINLQINKFDI